MIAIIRKSLAAVLTLWIGACGLHSAGVAQTNTENFAQFRFNFNNPGARAAGIGGAFMSIADDATASEANPAGLTTLRRAELSFETKGIQYTQRVSNFSSTGTATAFSLTPKDFRNAIVSPSFASVVLPVRPFTFAVFRHELMNFESSFFTMGSYIPGYNDGSFFYPSKSDTKIRVVDYGGTVAYKVTGFFSVGLSAGVSTISMQSSIARYYDAVFSDGTLANVATIDDSNTDFFINAGILVKPLDKLSLGLTYKRRPSFRLHQTYRFPAFPVDSSQASVINFNIPSSLGIGISYRPTDVLTFAFDAVRVGYASLTDNFVVTIEKQSAHPADYSSDNGMEYHGGGEYVLLLKSFGIAFRAGFYVEPDNRIRWVGPLDPEAALFQKGDATFHGTLGLGFLLSNSLQVDVAGTLSSWSNEVIGSFVVRL